MTSEKIKNELYEWAYSIVIALAVALFIHIFLFQPTRVSGESMVPTLENGDYLIVSKVGHVMGDMPEYGDIVIIDSRTHYDRTWRDDVSEPLTNYLAFFNKKFATKNIWVKRVIGHPGDTLEFKDGAVWRNGEKLDEPYINDEPMKTDGRQITVPENHVFVMGDNRNHSSDSRFIGPVPTDHVLGRVVLDL